MQKNNVSYNTIKKNTTLAGFSLETEEEEKEGAK
jgi:hypothetical protein